MGSDTTGAVTGTTGPRPVCFMVMPFRRRKVDGTQGAGAPGELDCDALWDNVFRPVIHDLGYLPIRADAETGSVIIKDMLERLAYAQLVIADVTLSNGNVYYEVGLRQAARERGCVLVAADWSKQLFDIDQFRSVRYQMSDGTVPDDQAARAREVLLERLPRVVDAQTPWHEFITGGDTAARAMARREQGEAVSALQARMGAVRVAPQVERADRVAAILAEVGSSTLTIPDVASELLVLVRDYAGWRAVGEFVQRLPEATRRLSFMREQTLLAQAMSGEPFEAIALLELLIAEHGETPERHGIIGGRHRRLWEAARKDRVVRQRSEPSADERRHLNQAIDHYSRGMELDYNQYYCSSNLPNLLRARNDTGEVERAAIVDQFVLAACERAVNRGEHDEWLKSTLLGAAFRAGDSVRAAALATQVETEGPATWKLAATLETLRVALDQSTDVRSKDALSGVLQRLEALAQDS